MARPKKKRSILLFVVLGAHALVGAALTLIPQDKLREVVGIAFAEAPKPKPPATRPPPRAAAAPRRAARAAAAPAPAANAAAAAGAAESGPVFAKLGISLDANSADGIAVPVAAERPKKVEIAFAPKAPKVLLARAEAACQKELIRARPETLVRPSYTPEARAAHAEGRVRLELIVDAEGKVTDVRVLGGLGYGLDEQAMNAARQMRFRPATRCGKAVSAPFVLSMRFVAGS